MSLLDTQEMISEESNYSKTIIAHSDSVKNLHISPENPAVVSTTNIGSNVKGWIKIEGNIKATKGHETAYLHAKILAKEILKEPRIRLRNPICKPGEFNSYEFYMKIPESKEPIDIIMLITSAETFDTELTSYTITLLQEK